MARKSGSTPQAMRNRAAKTAAAITPASPLAKPAVQKKRVSLPQFAREVRAEGRKITWTSTRETWITSAMVGVMVVLAAGFLQVVDLAFGSGMALVLKLANGG